MPLQILRLVSSFFHETGRSQGRFCYYIKSRYNMNFNEQTIEAHRTCLCILKFVNCTNVLNQIHKSINQ